MTLAPVAIFCHNRPEHLKNLLRSLEANALAPSTLLYIFADGPRTDHDAPLVRQALSVARGAARFQEVFIFQRETNWGLARNIIDGVGQVMREHGRAIVLEDDLELAPGFLDFMNLALRTYRDHPRVFSISGYKGPARLPDWHQEPIFLFKRVNSWGWASWQDRWESVDWQVPDFDRFIRDDQEIESFNLGGQDCAAMLLDQRLGRNDSWAIRFNYACHRRQMFNVYPSQSLVLNRGADGSGRHVGKTRRYETALAQAPPPTSLPQDPEYSCELAHAYRQLFRKSPQRMLINFLKIRKYRWGLRP